MPTTISITHSCYKCHRSVANAAALRRHLLTLHQTALPSARSGARRYDNEDFIYVKRLGNRVDSTIKIHHACPSYLLHYEELTDLKEHIEENHYIEAVLPEDNDTESETSLILIPTARDILQFSPVPASPTEPNQPKIPSSTIKALAPLVTIIAKDPHTIISRLKLYNTAHAFLLAALSQPLNELPQWLWNFTYADTIENNEKKLIKTMQFILTDFTSKCQRIQDPVASERTFFADRVVPILSHFGDQTGLLTYKWCETYLAQKADNSNDIRDFKGGKAKFIDGIGFASGLQKILVIESSCGLIAERIPHTVDDSVKQMHNTINLLNLKVADNMGASQETLKKAAVFSLQLVKNSMTLSTMRFEDDLKRYKYEHIGSSEIPTGFNQKTKWLKTFDLLTMLMDLLLIQQEVSAYMQDEQDGLIEVNYESSVRAALNQQ